MEPAPNRYKVFPIVDVARRCGLVIDHRTLGREEVEASCPFCGDHGPGKYHLAMNTARNVYRCYLCGASGNSVSLYARLEYKSYKQAADALDRDGSLYRFPSQPESQKTPERQPLPPGILNDVYSDLLSHLTLSDKHREDLRRRGLSEERIEQNQYRTLPASEQARRFAASLVGDFHTLEGVPGFGIYHGRWTLAGKPGLLVPYRDKAGQILGMQVRLDDETQPERKYRWFSSRFLDGGTYCPARIHVTGNQSARTVYLTEGGLKGDVASYLDGDAIFACFAGINTLGGLAETLAGLDVEEAVVALDMDKLTNWRVRNALENIRKTVADAGLRFRTLNWNMSFKGVDDFYKARRIASQRGQNMSQIKENAITDYLAALWKKEYPKQDGGFIRTCEWEELRVPLSGLQCDPPRDEVKARRYLKLVRERTMFPPLVCVNGEVIDGQHRFWAYAQAGVETVTIYQNKPWVLPAAA